MLRCVAQCWALRQNFASGLGAAAASFCSAFGVNGRLVPLPEGTLLAAVSAKASKYARG